MLLHILCSIMMMISAIICAPGQGRENAMRLVRNDKSNNNPNSNRITLDSIGGGNLMGSIDSYMERQVLRSLDDGEGRENMMRLARDDKSNNHTDTSNPNRGTLDPIGGGNILRSLDSYTRGQVHRSLDGGEGRENMVRLARDSRSDTHTGTTRKPIRGTLDSLGKGHILRSVDSYTGGEVHRSLDRNHVLDSLDGGEGRQNMMRLAREDKSNHHHDTSNSMHGVVDPLGGGNMVRSRDSYTGGQILRSLDRNHMLDSLDGGQVVRMLDAITGGDLLSTLESAEGAAVLRALKGSGTNKLPKRMLDSVSGWSFGESKRNFDEIDNVGFTGFAKRMAPYAQYRQLALAKKNFDEIDRAGFETYNKRNFDEIDRTGFETFEKREAKE